MQLCLAEVTIVSLTEDQKELSRFNEKYTKSALIQFHMKGELWKHSRLLIYCMLFNLRTICAIFYHALKLVEGKNHLMSP
jgi:hypothetical protein